MKNTDKLSNQSITRKQTFKRMVNIVNVWAGIVSIQIVNKQKHDNKEIQCTLSIKMVAGLISLVSISFFDAHIVRLPYFAPIIFLELPPFP